MVEIVGDADIERKSAWTRAALREAPDVIYQGAFLEGPWQGYSDFLIKAALPSTLGDYAYEVADTKLSRSAKPKHLMQMCVYSDILAREQGAAPERMHVVLGDGTIVSVRVDAVIHYFQFARDRFMQFTAAPPTASAWLALRALHVLSLGAEVRGRVGGNEPSQPRRRPDQGPG